MNNTGGIYPNPTQYNQRQDTGDYTKRMTPGEQDAIVHVILAVVGFISLASCISGALIMYLLMSVFHS